MVRGRIGIRMLKFEGLEVWRLALEYVDLVYSISNKLPRDEEYNLKSQIRRAATSIALNIAEGSTGQPDAEQARFLGMAIRSLLETVACGQLITRRGYLEDPDSVRDAYGKAETLAKMLQTMRRSIAREPAHLAEPTPAYSVFEEMT